MFWLDFVFTRVRKKEIGNHHRIDTMDFQTAKKEYIDMIFLIINELARITKPKSFFIIVIGDGIVNGKTIDMRIVIEELCENTAYNIQQIESFNLSETTKSFNKKFSRTPKKEHIIRLKNMK